MYQYLRYDMVGGKGSKAEKCFFFLDLPERFVGALTRETTENNVRFGMYSAYSFCDYVEIFAIGFLASFLYGKD